MRHARRWAGYGLLVAVIVLALVVSVANQLLPMVENHPAQIAAWLSKRVGEPVTFSRARAEWTRRGPRFILDDLHVGPAQTALNIGRAQLQVAMYSGLLPGQPLTELKIRDLSLTLIQADDGRWHVAGLPGQGGGGDALDHLDGFGELQIEKAQLTIVAPRLKVNAMIPRMDARIRVDPQRLQVGTSAWMDAGDSPVTAVLDFERKRRDGLLWIGASQLKLAHWLPLLASVGVVPQQGSAELALWARLRDRRVTRITVQSELNDAWLRAAQPLRDAQGNSHVARVHFSHMQVTARWWTTAHGWKLLAPRLNVTTGTQVAHLDGLSLLGGDAFALRGRTLDLSPLAAMLSLSDRFPDALRLFLMQSNPQAVLHDVLVQGARSGPLRGSLQVSGMSLQANGERPGLSGLGGRIQFDEDGGVMRIATAPVRVRWPVALREPVDLRLKGTLALWRKDAGWTFGTHQLQLAGEGTGARLRMQLSFQGDGTKPTLDLAANLDPATFDTAKKFWLLHRMSPATVHWLDTALVSGRVLDGRIAIAGDLDDWPFQSHIGSFDARAHISGATLKFNELWPAGEQLDMDVMFDGPGMAVTGTGLLMGNSITRVSGGIAQFHSPWLDLDIHADSAGEKLRQLMIASPLDKDYDQHLKALSINGNAVTDLHLHLPLRADLGERDISGTLDLDHAALADARWNIAFTDVHGRTRFTHRGFATEDLKVRYANQPGVFNLRVGEATGDRTLAAQANLDGRFTASTLIDRYPDLAWLAPWMKGASEWKVDVRIPSAAAGAGKSQPARLSLSSDLVGTAISLPMPLKKSEQAPLRLELLTALPLEQGELTLKLGNLMRLRAQLRKNAPMLGVLQFGDAAIGAYPTQGLSVRGSVPILDSIGWVGVTGKSGGASSATVHDIDVQAKQLIFIDRAFADSHLQLARSAGLTQVAIRGAGIDGSVQIPTDTAHGIQGRFAKLYLTTAANADGATVPATGALTTDLGQFTDPVQMPPLRFSVADLRIGQAQLGKAELVTTPVANGMRVDKFQTQARNLSLSAAGEWIRSGSTTRSNFRLSFNADSLGQMLDALGYANMVEDGRTEATLTGSWPGSPGAFDLSTLSGTLKAEVATGRLLDVEPGGSGRILGLISLAEIPRRLSLDFSDFFKKGFAFNSARGDFTFSDGKARTQNLRIDGPAAEIRVSGTTGMREQVYEQRVEVLPKAGGILPAIGLIAGGPAGAAVGAMAQAVLQRPLKQTTRVVYSITGPWAKPVIKVIEKGPRRAESEAATRSGAPASGQP